MGISDGSISDNPISAADLSPFYGLLKESVDFDDGDPLWAAIAPRTLTDTADFSDTPTAVAVSVLIEGLKFSDSVDPGVVLRPVLTEGIKLSDSITAVYQELLAEGIVLSDTQISLAHGYAMLADGVMFTDSPAAIARLRASLSDGVTLADYLKRIGEATIAEGLTFADTIALSAALALDDTVKYSDTLAMVRRGIAAVQSGVDFTDAATPKATLYALLQSGVMFGGSFSYRGVEYEAFVTNSHTLGVSDYTNYHFNSFAPPDLAANGTGIYQLTGSTDAGTSIAAHIVTGLHDYGSSLNKSFPDVWVGGTVDGKMVLKVTTSQSGEGTDDWYEIEPDLTTPDSTRFKPGRGLKSRYWKWRLENRSGADFDIDSFGLRPVILGRTH